jgi:PAS domain S-box-containing protein
LTTWQRHRWVIVGTLAVLGVQMATIISLVVQRARRREIAAALHKTQKRYSLASTAARVGVWDWDPGNGSLYVDPVVQELLGYPHSDGAQQLEDWLKLVHPEDQALVRDRLREHVEGDTLGVELEHRMRHRDGAVRWVLICGSAARDGDGLVRVVGTITDTTDRKRAEQQLQERQRELSRVARVTALGEFAASIAHEVRQPLTAIISSARAAARFLKSGATAEAQEALGYVLDASKQADRVIERNRELFRNHAVQKELLDWNSIVAEQCEWLGRGSRAVRCRCSRLAPKICRA